MPWEAWVLVIQYVIMFVFGPLTIGKPREPITATEWVIRCVMASFNLWLILRLAGVF